MAATKARIAKAGKKPAKKSAACKTCCAAKFAQEDAECMEENMFAQTNVWDEETTFAQATAEAEVSLDEIEEMLGDLNVDELAQIADVLESEDYNPVA